MPTKTQFHAAAVGLVIMLAPCHANAEVRTITATGEYRMGDNDTRTDAKRLALLDAKRLALEKAGTYLESVTEIKNLKVERDELRAYTAGIVEVTEQATKDVMEGATHIIRVAVTAKIDTAVVARQIDALRKNETARVELLRLRDEKERLRKEIQAETEQLASLKSGKGKEAALSRRQQAILQAFALLHLEFGYGLEAKGDLKGAISEYRKATQISPDEPVVHAFLALALENTGAIEQAIAAWQTVLRLEPNNESASVMLIKLFGAKGDLDGEIAEFRRWVGVQPDDTSRRLLLGHALEEKGDRDAAIAEYREVVRLKPHEYIGHLFLADVLKASGRSREAAQEYRESLKLLSKTSGKQKIVEGVQVKLRELER